jgi:hypothetical protein
VGLSFHRRDSVGDLIRHGLLGSTPSDFDGTPCTSPTALKTKVGWDNVTGMGTPNGQAFADFFKPAATTTVK